MAHFAQLDGSNNVINVIVVNNSVITVDDVESEEIGIEFCKSLFGADTKWKQTSYNSNFRKQMAGIGSTYSEEHDVFVSPQPFPSWTLDENHDWQPPTPRPVEGRWYWNEDELEWAEFAE